MFHLRCLSSNSLSPLFPFRIVIGFNNGANDNDVAGGSALALKKCLTHVVDSLYLYSENSCHVSSPPIILSLFRSSVPRSITSLVCCHATGP